MKVKFKPYPPPTTDLVGLPVKIAGRPFTIVREVAGRGNGGLYWVMTPKGLLTVRYIRPQELERAKQLGMVLR